MENMHRTDVFDVYTIGWMDGWTSDSGMHLRDRHEQLTNATCASHTSLLIYLCLELYVLGTVLGLTVHIASTNEYK
jgi:hypothetical protein